MLIKTKNPGLAGYIDIKGGKYLKYENGYYFFENTTKSFSQWRDEYFGSLFVKHNESVVRFWMSKKILRRYKYIWH